MVSEFVELLCCARTLQRAFSFCFMVGVDEFVLKADRKGIMSEKGVTAGFRAAIE